ncbi:MAG: hypothetical protein JO235_23830 [Chroococcidiopsidaceae cyanobacterium CP_BM_RX_35]|nr:hypothetical protein [Chroococcidiopsidaceae cyanobacterium CP_BM_RX_35]
MEAKFTRSFLAATLAIYGVSTTIAKAQVASTNSVEMVAAQPLVTIFSCVHNGNGFVTIARRGDRITPPIIIWEPALGYYTPKAHCYIVSQQLTQIVAQNGGKLNNLQLVTGTVRNQIVICAVKQPESSCNSSNMLFTLRPEKPSSADEVIAKLNQLPISSSGNIATNSSEVNSLPLEDLNRFLGPEKQN